MLCIKGSFLQFKKGKCNIKLHELLKYFLSSPQFDKESQCLEVHVKPNVMGTVELLAMINKPSVSLCTTLLSLFVGVGDIPVHTISRKKFVNNRLNYG